MRADRQDDPTQTPTAAGATGGGSPRRRLASVVSSLLRDRIAVAVFVAVTVLGLLVYRVWLPIPSITFSIVLSLAFGAVFAIQAHALRRTMRAHRSGATRRGLVGVLGFVVSCLPCVVGVLAPAIPAAFAAVGLSAIGAKQFMMANMPLFLIASVLILAASGGWSLRQLATA